MPACPCPTKPRRPAAVPRFFAACAALALSVVLVTAPAGAQATAAHHHESMASDDAEHGAHAQMQGAMADAPHMRMTPRRAPSAADSARAAAIADTLRHAIAKYRDVQAARDDGWVQFAPQVKNQRVYHFTRRSNAIRNQFGFDPARPTSLLYRKDDAGRFVLVGAMYTAPRRASLDDLDARVPLGVAQWHLHTNFCVPKRRERDRWRETKDGAPVFGPLSPIASRDACDAVGGRFHETVLNWMVHANVFDPGDPWHDDHHAAGHDMH